ncbi:NADPH-dependent F420 reductase [Jiangella anatolica]|uniref:NADP oxidoreductase n=1 Tax=Jiangella anatolica TaxID=2670374 RepID=A0A2W2C7X3_9ACTN|nr:NAD(P)-binding domain-containing protein [Jiangella anatolica]PZF81836.1 NADP oxidoreductase [Jiangella anatolica]
MRVAVLGTGMVGQAVAGRFDELGHDVHVGTRDPAATMSRTEPDQLGNPPFPAWRERHPGVRLDTYADAAAVAELVVNATPGTVTLEVLEAAGAEHLDGKVLIDISNPLVFTPDGPPTLFVENTDSLGERIQRAYPGARVVKALNTVNAELMAHPATLAGGDHSIFVCGDDATAKAQVTEVLTSFGHTDVIDLGGIISARGVEMYLPVWLRLMAALGTARFNVRVIR